jgi:putative DNA primase/helicase
VRTGECGEHKPDHFMSKLAPWKLDVAAKCDAWREHLKLVMDGDNEVIEFLQRAYGSCLTGIIADRKVYIQWGAGRNGKSVTNEAISTILGDYATRTPADILLTRRDVSVSNDIARLKGARFVYAAETDKGRRLSESLIKDLTGGEKIMARFFYQEFFEFYPTFKIWLSTNNRPEIRGTDEGIWDRICLIPYNVRIPDKKLKKPYEILESFREEGPGILGWLMQGAYEWYHNGLNPPERVKAAVKTYREEQDDLAGFFEEQCLIGEKAEAKTSDIYARYLEWAENNNEKRPLSKRALASELAARGCTMAKVDGTRGWRGIGLMPTWTT